MQANHVDRVYVLLKLLNGLHVLRPAESIENGVLIETWEQFQKYKHKRFTDVLHRHLYCNRTFESKFVERIQEILENLKKEPYVKDSKGTNRIFKSSELAAHIYISLGFLPESKLMT